MKNFIRFALISAALLFQGAVHGQQLAALRWSSSGASPTPLAGGVFAFSINNSGAIGFGTTGRGINSSGNILPEGRINDAGHSIIYGANGAALYTSGSNIGGFWVPSGTPTVLGNLGGDGYTSFGGINNSDYICGQSHAANGKQHAFVRSPGGTMTDLGTLQGASGTSWALAINDSNWIGGASTHSDGTIHAVVWDNTGAITDLGITGTAFGINSSNQVVGIRFGGTGDRAFSWTSGGGVVILTFSAGRYSFAFAVNDSGVIVGGSL